jgi:hypothetical protein
MRLAFVKNGGSPLGVSPMMYRASLDSDFVARAARTKKKTHVW